MDVAMDKKPEEKKPEPVAIKKPEENKVMSSEKRKLGVGMDIGTMTCISAVMKDEGISYKVQRDAFFDIENNMMSKSMLTKLKANFIESEDKKHLYVVGDEALEMANFFNREIRRPLSQGVISTREKEALAMIKIILHGVIGDPIQQNEVCHFSVPATPVDADYNIVYHQNILKSFVTSFGYKAVPMNEATAIGWSELENDNYTGMQVFFYWEFLKKINNSQLLVQAIGLIQMQQ